MCTVSGLCLRSIVWANIQFGVQTMFSSATSRYLCRQFQHSWLGNNGLVATEPKVDVWRPAPILHSHITSVGFCKSRRADRDYENDL